MSQTKQFFLSGIGGSGMLSLAILLREQGHLVRGSDRARDQGRTPDKFAWLEGQGETLVIGMGTMFHALEEQIAGMAMGDTKTTQVPSDKAFGPRNPGCAV